MFSPDKSGLIDCFKLNWREPTEPPLAAPAVVFRLDPVNDFLPQLVTGRPATSVQDVLLEQAVERFHRGVVAGRADPTRPIEPLMPLFSSSFTTFLERN